MVSLPIYKGISNGSCRSRPPTTTTTDNTRRRTSNGGSGTSTRLTKLALAGTVVFIYLVAEGRLRNCGFWFPVVRAVSAAGWAGRYFIFRLVEEFNAARVAPEPIISVLSVWK